MTKILITGGAGFIGSNLAQRLLNQGHSVTIFDNLSRPGTKPNLSWLQSQFKADQLKFVHADITNFEILNQAMSGMQRVYHLAGQVAVTTSVKDPRRDFIDNALGTFNALEAARLSGDDPIFLYASTNKVYGGMQHARIVDAGNRYTYADMPEGVSEDAPLDFHSPYGCSKGAGDQYTRDYARIYGLRTVVLRQSCIYGYRQFGLEDQGWVAWFIIAALKCKPISIYGDGRQVRDILFIEDLLKAYDAAVQQIDHASGEIYNVGGGLENTLSVWSEFGPLLEELLGRTISVTYNPWRPGDQKVYISNIHKIRHELGWAPEVTVRQGITRLYEWIRKNLNLFKHI